MKAIGYREAGPLSEEATLIEFETGIPEPRPNDLLVQIRGVSVNPVDLRARAGIQPDERLEGGGEDAAPRIIVEWPSKEAASAFMSGPIYRPHLEARTADSDGHHFLIEGKDDLA